MDFTQDVDDAKDDEKPHLSCVILGHHNSGKSTALGHLLYLCEEIDKEELDEVETEAENQGREGVKYAWLLDRAEHERIQRVSTDVHVYHMETNKRMYTLIDVPGHVKYTKNVIAGCFLADVGIMMVSCKEEELQAGLLPTGQTREHAVLAYAFGVKKLLICITKMDAKPDSNSNPYNFQRFNRARSAVWEVLALAGFDGRVVTCIPISGWLGDNMLQRSPKMPWHRGPSLLDAMEAITIPKQAPLRADKPLRIVIREAYEVGRREEKQRYGLQAQDMEGESDADLGSGGDSQSDADEEEPVPVALGRVLYGSLHSGAFLLFAPAQVPVNVSMIQAFNEPIAEATPGDFVGLSLAEEPSAFMDVARGTIVSDLGLDPARPAVKFVSQIVVTDMPKKLRVGYKPTLYCHCASVPCTVTKIKATVSHKDGKLVRSGPDGVAPGQSAIVEMVPEKPICLETFSDYPDLGRFACRDSGRTVFVGIINAVWKENDDGTVSQRGKHRPKSRMSSQRGTGRPSTGAARRTGKSPAKKPKPTRRGNKGGGRGRRAQR